MLAGIEKWQALYAAQYRGDYTHELRMLILFAKA
jgi:hypothetical protein